MGERGKGKRTLHVLFVEDSDDDAVLLAHELRRGGYTVESRRVQSEAGMSEALAAGGWDLVLSDYDLPHFDGMSALRLLRETDADMPFIVVSGAIGEETAVEIMKAGAQDYVMKDKLTRLLPAVARELRDAEVRRRRREAERALAQIREKMGHSERLAILGVMAGGIAHEVNQPLNALKITTDGLEYQFEQGREIPLAAIRERLRRVSAQAAKIDEIIQHMRALAQPGTDRELGPVPLWATVEKALSLVRARALNHEILVKTDKDDGPDTTVWASPIELEQVLINLVVNAVQALDTVDREEKWIRIAVNGDGDRAFLRVSDNGPGFESGAEHIFDPFVTTKSPEQGMGIGLSIVRQFVSVWNGEITAENRPGGGALFTVTMQRAGE